MADDSGGVGVGGDGSVAWTAWAGCVRRGSIVSKPSGEYGYLQYGVDETDPGKAFTIGIKVPRENGADLARALYEAAKDADAHAGEPGYRVKFPLVIEPKNEDQILITWESATPPKKGGRPRPKKKHGKAAASRRKPAARKAAKAGARRKKKKSGKKR